MFVETACHVSSFVAHREFFAQGSGVELRYVPGEGAA
jgi:hypothetical protein